MEDEHSCRCAGVYHTPTHNNKPHPSDLVVGGGSGSGTCQVVAKSTGERGLAPYHINRGNGKFVNTRSYATLTTNLSAEPGYSDFKSSRDCQDFTTSRDWNSSYLYNAGEELLHQRQGVGSDSGSSGRRVAEIQDDAGCFRNGFSTDTHALRSAGKNSQMGILLPMDDGQAVGTNNNSDADVPDGFVFRGKHDFLTGGSVKVDADDGHPDDVDDGQPGVCELNGCDILTSDSGVLTADPGTFCAHIPPTIPRAGLQRPKTDLVSFAFAGDARASSPGDQTPQNSDGGMLTPPVTRLGHQASPLSPAHRLPVPNQTADTSQRTCPASVPFSNYSPRHVPRFHRQLSKRKSDTIESQIPQRIVEENEAGSDEDDDDDYDYHSLGKASDPCTPTSPKSRRLDNFDPYQIFEVQHTPCLILTARVLSGRNISNGWIQDCYDIPDPYVNLVLKSSPEGRKSTSVKENCTNPVWDETFTFFINFEQANVIEISLMESNMVFDQKVGTAYFDTVNIREMDKPQVETFIFNKESEVDIEFKLEFDRNPTLRYSLCLSDAEKEFISQRKEKILEVLQGLLGENDGPMNIEQVPTIAVIGSGGGFRAMTGYSGVFKALVESGVLDCTTYACGLSGSSWLISTLYSHPKWPNLDMDDFLNELKNSIDKSLLRFFNVSTIFSYAKFMVQKRKEGQPVSFTDIFGRMVGETLLQDRMESTLTDQREKIKGGITPMPLYTCVHVKKDVPARSFQEWVEFSPYEIGMPKYGTFMDSELFGSKFFMGKLVKKYKEEPLHFLQGIWGSAFCILFRRLMEDNRRLDPPEMLRIEMDQKLQEEGQDSSSDPSDDDADDTDDDSSSSLESQGSDTGSVKHVEVTTDGATTDGATTDGAKVSGVSWSQNISHDLIQKGNIDSSQKNHFSFDEISNDSSNSNTGVETDSFADSAYEGEGEEEEDERSQGKSCSIIKKSVAMIIEPKIEFERRQGQSAAEHNVLKSGLKSPGFETSDGLKKSVNWGECPTPSKKAEHTDGSRRRQAFVRAGSSFKKSKSGSKSYWKNLMQGIVESNSWELFSTRRGRAAVIHNFMRGLSLQQTYPISPFTPVEERVKEGDMFDGIFEMHSTSIKHIYMVDAGLTFNSPYPLVLRPQRQVDIILSFDFSARESDNSPPFKELLLAEKWARLNRLPFPPIDTTVFEREGMKELYIFRHPTDPHCPIVFHFVLVNKLFKLYKAPGVPRQTKEEFDFAEFDVFDDPNAPYSTFNFTYTHDSFDKLSKLMEFNTLLHIEDIKNAIRDVVRIKRECPPRVPIQSKDIKLLRMKSVQEMRKLKRFISKMESRSSVYSSSTPPTPFFTPTPTSATRTNPFFSGLPRQISEGSVDDAMLFASSRNPLSSKNRNSRSSTGIDEVDCVFIPNKVSCSSASSEECVFGTPPSFPACHQKSASSQLSCQNPMSHDSHQTQNFDRPFTIFKSSSENSIEIPMSIPAAQSPNRKISIPNAKLQSVNSVGFKTPESSSSGISSAGYSPQSESTSQSRSKKDQPPNPFFINAHFMRSAYNWSSSSSSSSSSSPHHASAEIESERKLRGRPHQHSTQIPSCSQDRSSPRDPNSRIKMAKISPLARSGNSAAAPDLVSTQTSVDDFTLAPEAFKSDGTPVTNSKEAKMYYESAKEKRKLLRRQSTITSINSISLDETWPPTDQDCPSEFEAFSHSGSNDTGLGADVNSFCSEEAENITRGHDSLPFDIKDLSQFNGVEEVEMVPEHPEQSWQLSNKAKRLSSIADTWHDARDSLDDDPQ